MACPCFTLPAQAYLPGSTSNKWLSREFLFRGQLPGTQFGTTAITDIRPGQISEQFSQSELSRTLTPVAFSHDQ